MKILVLLAFIISSLGTVEAAHFSGSVGPAIVGINFSNSGTQLFIHYTGYLFNNCKDGYDKGNNVTAVFIFPRKNQNNIVIKREMGHSCTTPWSYTLPTASYTSIYNDPELMDHFASRLSEDGRSISLEVAFEYQNNWDSNYGHNYHLILNREN